MSYKYEVEADEDWVRIVYDQKEMVFIFHLNHDTKIAKLISMLPLFDDGADGDDFKNKKISLDELKALVPSDFYIDMSVHEPNALLSITEPGFCKKNLPYIFVLSKELRRMCLTRTLF